MKIGFIGLGHMGAPMARNLLRAGHELVVFDVVLEPVAKLTAQGASSTGSPRAVAASEVEVILTMLPSSPQVRSVYEGDQGILGGVRPGVLLIDSSTIDPQTARSVAAAARKQGNPMIDAPVSGGTAGAEGGNLTFMVGGETAHFEAAKPILTAMGKNLVHCGAAGNGQVAKLANNLLLAISMIGVSESMTLGVALGMDPAVLAQVINTSSGRCWSSETYNPFPGVLAHAPSSRGYTGGFGANLMLKDLRLALGAANAVKHPLFLGPLAEQLYQELQSRGKGALDFSSVIELYREKNEEDPPSLATD